MIRPVRLGWYIHRAEGLVKTRIGDVVPWSRVPHGAVVADGSSHALRVGNLGHWLYVDSETIMMLDPTDPWRWAEVGSGEQRVTIVALLEVCSREEDRMAPASVDCLSY